MTPRTPNTRPTDAEIIKMLRDIVNPPSRRDREGISRHAIRQGEALTMASALEGAEPRTYGDGEARYATPEAAATDSVSVRETFDEYDYVRYASYKGATRRDVIRAVLRSVGMETQEPYTVSGVDYTFTEGC